MRSVILAVSAIAALAATPALADDRAIITKAQQDMSDAIVPGDVAVWDKYLDPKVIIAEEDGSFKGKADMLKEISPMPKGLSGNIKVELLSYSEDGDTAVALFREHETEHYYGQTIHASYLSNTTWKKRPDNWKLIEVQLIAERTDELTRANADLQERYRDVRQAQRLLRDTQAELIQAGKLGMLGQMAAGVTHELNQPLTAMQVFADNAAAFLARGDTAAAGENLQHIADATARMGALVAQLKTFARKSDGAPGPVELARAVANAERLLRADFEQAGATLEIVIEQPAVVLGDAIRVEQVLINLVRNALDAVRPCATRRVRVTVGAGDEATVRIADTGPGLSAEVRAHLFEPFFTTKPSGAGLGLGLAISSSIVQAMAGTLTAGDAPCGGAEFVLALPLQAAVPAQETTT